MGIRKNILFMPSDERDAFFEALLRLKNKIVNPNAAPQDQYSVYDQYTSLHFAVFAVASSANTALYNAGHAGPAFLSWHRELLRRFEMELQIEVPGVMLPYWDWSPNAFTTALMGPNGGPNGNGGGDVETGWFAYDRPGTPNTPNANVTLPNWWPQGLLGWRIRDDLSEAWGTVLQRFMGQANVDTLPVQSDVSALLSITAANPNDANQRNTAATNFRSALEVSSNALGVTSSHNEVHRYVGGHMVSRPSPNDPIFWLHHCNIDRLWAMWQLDGHAGAGWFPVLNSEGHQLNDPMWPWVGNVAPYVIGTAVPTYYLPSFANDPVRRNQDVLDHHALGIAYDTEPVLGVALDRSGSMTGASTDPFNMGAPTTKWALAKIGVSNLLADCEAAYTAREAFVIGGVQTFTTTLGAVDVSPVVANRPYGLIRSGANYPGTYPAADVDAALAALNPAGGTPIASALDETYADVVRPLANALPSDDVRYLSILTDGKETVPPLLSTIAAGQFADTYIFGMGFGSGTGWDGVDYASIQTIVSKGKAPPQALNLTQIYQGETMNAIDKFYSNTIARVIGYVPVTDPTFDVFPNEELHIPFWATSADDGFFITVLRGDDDPDRWHLMLEAPDGKRYDESGGAPYFITIQRRGHRDTVFLRRARADDKRWIGRWHLHMAYCCGKEDHEHAAGHAHTGLKTGGMLMHTRFDLMLPSSAPPVVGPVFSQFDVSMAKRISPRLLPERKFPSLGAPVLEREPDGTLPTPSRLVVNIYSRSSLQVGLRLEAPHKFAGHPIRAVLDFDDPEGGVFSRVRASARLVAPRTRIGDAFLDHHTIPVADRKRYVTPVANRERFDELRFLADYERKKPGVFAPRDELLELRPDGARFVGRIGLTDIAGVYHVGALVEGFLIRPGRAPEYFTRTLSADVSLGVLIDAKRSDLTVKWHGPDRFELTITPQDRYGNLISPSSVHRGFDFGGLEAEASHENPFDGSHKLVVTLRGDGGKREGGAGRVVLHLAAQSLLLQPPPPAGKSPKGA